MMPLCFAEIGAQNTIQMVTGKPEVKKHLENLGFVEGENVTVVSTVDGNMIVKVMETRVAINQDMAKKIMI